MRLSARLSRMEKHVPPDPLRELTDEELEAAIEALNKSLASGFGTPSEGMIDVPVNLDEQQLYNLVRCIKGVANV